MAYLKGDTIEAVSLSEAAGSTRLVPQELREQAKSFFRLTA
jgi:hypothetical protein